MEETEDLNLLGSDKESEEISFIETFNKLPTSVPMESLEKPGNSSTVNKPVKLVKLPIHKVKQIMKMDPDCAMVQQDAVFLVTKATEMFIEFMARETNKQLAGNKRKTVMKRDVDATIESIPQLCFLDGALE